VAGPRVAESVAGEQDEPRRHRRPALRRTAIRQLTLT
jgi:hypothetical protein